MAETINSHKKIKIFKCPDCAQRYTSLNYLIKHVAKEHKESIKDGMSVKQYVFNRLHHKDFQLCVICKKNKTKFNENTMRYNRFCSEECRKKAGELAENNLKRKTGKTRSERMSDPETQKELLASKQTSGTYTFSDGKTKINYASSYELDFVKFYDNDYKGDPLDLIECPYTFEYIKDNKKHFYMPDYFIPSLKLIIEIKWAKKEQQVHDTELKEKYREDAVKQSGKFNFIKIRDMDYSDFLRATEILKERNTVDDENFDILFITS